MVTAITRDNVINKISIMLSVVGEWIKNRCLTPELVEFLEFVSTVGINNQEIVRWRSTSDRGLGQNKMGFVFILPLDVLTGRLDGWFHQ